MSEKVAVLGLGYVGLPVAVGFAEHFENTIGFDISTKRVQALQQYHDWTGEVESDRLKQSGLRITNDINELKDSTFYVACVPTPINDNREPDLTPLRKVCDSVGPLLKKGDVVVFESTVYPGVTEEICGPWLEELSGLEQGVDFHLGYSPERINPGDKEHQLENIYKVVSGDSPEITQRVSNAYKKIVTKADVHVAPSIKVAEMAKVIENTQRDLNIALMNEIAIICEKMNIRTKDVLDAAGTKWNFLPFKPGLVGGHCIGVDPYYLTAKAEQMGYHPNVILAGRRINDSMGRFIADKMIKMQVQSGKAIRNLKIGVLGLSFKEDVNDTRNSKVPDIIRELNEYAVEPLLYDPLVDQEAVKEEYGLSLVTKENLSDLDGLIYAVPHKEFEDIDIFSLMKKDAVLIDIKSILDPADIPDDVLYWSL